MQPEEIIDHLTGRFGGLAPKASWGETSLFYNPDLALANGVYFCTIKEHDGANDKASALDRPGVFRMAFGLTVKNYEKLFGSRPARPAKGSPVKTGHDFTRLDVVMPHPIYAWMGWAQVLNPSAETFASVQPLLVDSYDQVVSKFAKTLAGQRRTVRQRSLSAKVAKTNGGVPPFGFPQPLRVFVDTDLLQYDEVWAAAGTWNDNFGAAPADIVRVAGGVVTDLKRGQKEVMNLLEEYAARSVLCWLATVDVTGAPNLSPKEVFGLVDGRIVIANIASPRSSRNLRSNPRVCVSLLDIFEQKGVRVTGLGAVCSADDVEMVGARALLNTRTEGRFPFSEIFVIEVGDVQPFSAPSWHLYPEVDPAERRTGVLRTYGVHEIGD